MPPNHGQAKIWWQLWSHGTLCPVRVSTLWPLSCWGSESEDPQRGMPAPLPHCHRKSPSSLKSSPSFPPPSRRLPKKLSQDYLSCCSLSAVIGCICSWPWCEVFLHLTHLSGTDGNCSQLGVMSWGDWFLSYLKAPGCWRIWLGPGWGRTSWERMRSGEPGSLIDQTLTLGLLYASTKYVTHINSFHPPGNGHEADANISINVLLLEGRNWGTQWLDNLA